MKGIFTALAPVVPQESCREAVDSNTRAREEALRRAFGSKALLAYPDQPLDLGRTDTINGLFDTVGGEIGFGGIIIGTNATDDGIPDQATLARLVQELKPALVVEMVDRDQSIGETQDGKPIFAFSHFCRVTPSAEVQPIN